MIAPMYTLRPYQQRAVDSTLAHFKRTKNPAVITLPTGAGKSLVIASLAKIASGRVLVLAHVKELVEQNHQKYESYGQKAGIYSAGLGRKDSEQKVIFSSIQSLANTEASFFEGFTILIIDECHRVSVEGDTQYAKVINQLKQSNPKICILGLTATPYRLGMGWIYEFHYRGELKTSEQRFFKKCIFELPLKYMVDHGYLTPPMQIDSPVACYDFSSLLERTGGRKVTPEDLEAELKDQKRVTPSIMKNIVDLSEDREGVMIFTSSVSHAAELLEYLPKELSRVVVGSTSNADRDQIINDFKQKKVKYLINVSVLTTGFDAPHVDVIALLRPTKSIGLYQQIVGRGLRLSPGKEDCLILDYTGLSYDIFNPQIGTDKPSTESVPVEISCPSCGLINDFWGIKDEFGEITEHFGRRCSGAKENLDGEITECGFRFRYKLCDSCNAENDIAARICTTCSHQLIDTDKKLKEAMSLRDAHVMKPDTMTIELSLDKKNNERLEIRYYDYDAEYLSEFHYVNSKTALKAFSLTFVRMHTKLPGLNILFKSVEEIIEAKDLFKIPMFIIARKEKYFWRIREKVFHT